MRQLDLEDYLRRLVGGIGTCLPACRIEVTEYGVCLDFEDAEGKPTRFLVNGSRALVLPEEKDHA